MKIQLEQLPSHLNNQLASLYLVTGDECLLVQEACDLIRKEANKNEPCQREIFYIESGFNWEEFLNSANNSSIFSDRTIIELHLKSKIAENGKKVLQNYAKNPARDKIVVIIADKLDAAQQKSGWYKDLETHGVIVQIWPINSTELPGWIKRRLKSVGLDADFSGIQILVDHVAGNLLAAKQEIEKLALLYGQGTLASEQISAAITDHSHFNIFNLLDAAVNNKPSLANKIFERLKTENIEPTLILWAITNELRLLIDISYDLKQGLSIDQALAKNHIWSSRKPLIKKALGKYNLTQLLDFLKSALHIDLIIKGANNQNLLWHELGKLYLNFADSKFPPPHQHHF